MPSSKLAPMICRALIPSLLLLASTPTVGAAEPPPPGVPQAQADMVRRTYQLLVDGNRAYLATTVGVVTVDISTPAQPSYAGALLLADSVNDLALVDKLLLAANGPEGLIVAKKNEAGELTKLSQLRLSGSAMGVAATGQLALVASGTAGLQLVDLWKPRQPQKLQRLDTAGYCRDVIVQGDLAYAGDGDSVVIYRLKKNQLHSVGRLKLGGQVYQLALRQHTIKVLAGEGGLGLSGTDRATGPKPGWIVRRDALRRTILQERLLVVAAGTAGLVVVDVSRPEAPRVISRAPVKDTAHGIALSGQRVVLADGTAGLVLFDLARADQPKELTRLKTERPVNKVVASGSQLYAANDYDGLLVLQLEKDGKLTIEGSLPQHDAQ